MIDETIKRLDSLFKDTSYPDREWVSLATIIFVDTYAGDMDGNPPETDEIAEMREADAAFIAALRNAYPALRDELARLRKVEAAGLSHLSGCAYDHNNPHESTGSCLPECPIGKIDKLMKEIARLRKVEAAYRLALEEIENPIKFIQRTLQEGERINAGIAMALANDASYLREIARKALASKPEVQS